jgi:signal transduction histidine kinase
MSGLFGAFWNGAYAPHGYCLLWQPELIWTHVIADSVIALAYFSIPVALVTLVRRRRDLAFGWAFWLFALFILACGLTHVMAIVTLWKSLYGLEAVVKVITAIASIGTAALLWPLLPKAVALPSPARLQATNDELAALIAERDAALADLRHQIEQREQAEAALLQSQKLEAIGQLTGGIAHDFNNLLQAVAGNLELIQRSPTDTARVTRWTGAARDAVDRGRRLTAQLLAFSRKQRLILAPVALAELLDGVGELVEKALAPLAHVTVADVDPTLHVVADPLQLELAILNLCFNARDAMPEGGTVRIAAERRSGIVHADLPAGDYVALTVADAGTGMTPEVRARALEPFFTTKEVGRGTGMGLSMVFGVMTQSGGTVTIDSEAGGGTVITLFLKVSDAVPAKDARRDDGVHAEIDLTGRTILLADDDGQVRPALADALRAAGATVVEAEDGTDCLARLEGVRPDLLVLDFAMPGMNGAEVARRSRETHGALPILLVTGFADSAKLDQMAGDVAILHKPFTLTALLRAVADRIG